jgi:hypothetical protein
MIESGLLIWDLRSQPRELFGRREAPFGPAIEWGFPQLRHDFNTGQDALDGVERFALPLRILAYNSMRDLILRFSIAVLCSPL